MQYALLLAILLTQAQTHTAAQCFQRLPCGWCCFVLSALTVSGGLGRRMLKLKAQQALWSGWLLCCTLCWSWRRGQHECRRRASFKRSVCQSYITPQEWCAFMTLLKVDAFEEMEGFFFFFTWFLSKFRLNLLPGTVDCSQCSVSEKRLIKVWIHASGCSPLCWGQGTCQDMNLAVRLLTVQGWEI